MKRDKEFKFIVDQVCSSLSKRLPDMGYILIVGNNKVKTEIRSSVGSLENEIHMLRHIANQIEADLAAGNANSDIELN